MLREIAKSDLVKTATLAHSRPIASIKISEQNRLKQWSSGGTNVFFGYAYSGERLWTSNAVTGKLTFWIGGVFESKNGKDLCHVFAAGKRICTFEPDEEACLAWLPGWDHIVFCGTLAANALTWPFNERRALPSLAILALLGVLGASVLSRWRERLACGCFWLRLWWRNRRQRTHRSQSKRAANFANARESNSWLRECGSRLRATTLPSWLFVLLRGPHSGLSLFRSLLRDLREFRGRLASFDVESSMLDVRRSSRSFAASPFRRFAASAISVTLIVSLFLATTVEVHAVPTYDPVFYYYHGDHLGSSNVLTDRCGEVVQHYEYSGYGKERFKDNTSAFKVSNRYTDQILDEDTGLYYYGARYYDPELARFTQADTIVPSAADPQTLNRYAYAGNNPLKYIDPSGNFFIAAAAAIMGGLFSAGTFAGGYVASTYYNASLTWYGLVNMVTGNSYASRAFGSQVGGYIDAAAGITSALTMVIVGMMIGAIPGMQGMAATMIYTGILSLAAVGAGMAGDRDLAEALGWAAFGVGVAATFVSVSISAYEMLPPEGGALNLSIEDTPAQELPKEAGERPIKGEILADAKLQKQIEHKMTIPTGKDQFERAAYIIQREDGSYKLSDPRMGTLQDTRPSKTQSHPGAYRLKPGETRVGVIHTHGIPGRISPADISMARGFRTASHFVIDMEGVAYRLNPFLNKPHGEYYRLTGYKFATK